MNSLNDNAALDDLIRQALQPVAEAEPPESVWRGIAARVRGARGAGHRRWTMFSWFRGAELLYTPRLTRPYCVGSYERCLVSPLTSGILIDFRGQQLAS